MSASAEAGLSEEGLFRIGSQNTAVGRLSMATLRACEVVVWI